MADYNPGGHFLIAYYDDDISKSFIIATWQEWCNLGQQGRSDLASNAQAEGFSVAYLPSDNTGSGMSAYQFHDLVLQFDNYRLAKMTAGIS